MNTDRGCMPMEAFIIISLSMIRNCFLETSPVSPSWCAIFWYRINREENARALDPRSAIMRNTFCSSGVKVCPIFFMPITPMTRFS